jgi:hypothetical protein
LSRAEPHADDRDLIERALAAISSSSPALFEPLADPEQIEIRTGRGSHRGIEAALRWVRRGYDHLDRRYVLETLHALGDVLVGSGRVEYVWRESGEVGDSSPSWFGARIEEGLLVFLTIGDSEAQVEQALLA